MESIIIRWVSSSSSSSSSNIGCFQYSVMAIFSKYWFRFDVIVIVMAICLSTRIYDNENKIFSLLFCFKPCINYPFFNIIKKRVIKLSF